MKRYDMEVEWNADHPCARMEECEEGEWVRYEDVLQALAEKHNIK